jgi:hypothetical protein
MAPDSDSSKFEPVEALLSDREGSDSTHATSRSGMSKLSCEWIWLDGERAMSEAAMRPKPRAVIVSDA